MNNNITGFNPQAAKRQIEGFQDYGFDVTAKLYEAWLNFWLGLPTKWYSPNAVEFENQFCIPLFNAITNLRTLYSSIAQNAQNAYNANATANGVSPIYISVKQRGLSSALEDHCKPENPETGDVGMYKEQTATLVSTFCTEIDNCIKIINSTPFDIELYDTGFVQKLSYKMQIAKMKMDFTVIYTSFKSKINEQIESEMRNLDTTVSSAKEILKAAHANNPTSPV